MAEIVYAPDRDGVECFLWLEARLLDEKQWQRWQALYVDDGDYWVPLGPEQTDPLHEVSIFYEDRVLRELRIRRYAHPNAFSQLPPSRTVHLVSNVMIDGIDGDGHIRVNSRFIMIEHRRERQYLYGGAYSHLLAAADDGLHIIRKRVDLVNCDAPLESIQVYL